MEFSILRFSKIQTLLAVLMEINSGVEEIGLRLGLGLGLGPATYWIGWFPFQTCAFLTESFPMAVLLGRQLG
jgi:hypothetical protein